MASNTSPTAEKAKTTTPRPTKPDENAFTVSLQTAEAELKEIREQLNTVKNQIDLASPHRAGERQSPKQQRREQIIAELEKINVQQNGYKALQANEADKLKRLEEDIKFRKHELQQAQAHVTIDSLDELVQTLEDMEAKMKSGKLKLVEEHKMQKEVVRLKQMRRRVEASESLKQQIADLEAQRKQLKGGVRSGNAATEKDPERRALLEREEALQDELNQIKEEAQAAQKNLSTLRDERTKLSQQQREKLDAIRQLKDDYYSLQREYKKFEEEARQRARERRREEQRRQELERKKAEAKLILDQASIPAFSEELRRVVTLVQFLDPSRAPPVANEKFRVGGGNALALGAPLAVRTVDASAVQGVKLAPKDERGDDYLPAHGKKSANKKGHGAKKFGHDGQAKIFNLPPSVVDDCNYLDIDTPMSTADVSRVVDIALAKYEEWKARQPEVTKQNIEKAKKEVARLEKETSPNEEGAANGGEVDSLTNQVRAIAV